ncbi:MAG TPA: FMN-binding negative transcriptional regulator [Candidatus Tumulicola sp.]|jgi:transcriptional regulator
MYVPSAFAVGDRAFALDLIAQHPFGLLASCSEEHLQATHLPMIARSEADELWIAGHVARGSPHARQILEGRHATAIFQGPHAYVSPTWYEAPYTNVPTWNYTAVHAAGRLEECDPRRFLDRLTAVFESETSPAWTTARMDAAYYEKQLHGIVAFEMQVDRLDVVAKLSQNRSEADRARVIERLSASARESDRACAQAMLASSGEPEKKNRGSD